MGSAASVHEKAREMNYYEILQVEKTATDADLKKAYRKQALLLHPDRNHGNVEEATAKFAVVQAAYDVLSDSQERAWYDSHGMSMGSGGPGGSAEDGVHIFTTTEDLMRWFDPLMFANVDPESPNNFWATASSIFNQLAQEEREAAMDADVDTPILPAFGNSKSSWQHETRVFYDNWTNFSTAKQMAHKDMYREKDAPDRRVKRAMQGHNKKARDAAKKEYNDAVRAFVRFIKKRDPRVKLQAQQAKEASLSGGKTAAEAQAYRARMANMAKRQEEERRYKEQAWQKVVEDEENPTAVVGEDEEEEETEEEDIWECVVCDKEFKTEQMLQSHEQSRKHAKALHKLRREMRKEGLDLGLDETPEPEDEEEDEVEPELVEEEEEEEEAPVKPKKQVNAFALLADEEEEGDNDDDVSEEDDISEDNVEVEEKEASPEPSKPSKPEEEESLEALLAKLNGSSLSDNEELDAAKGNKKVGKARAKRNKKNENTAEFASTCGVCKTVFDSRTKLFDHIEKSGHAVPVAKPKKGKKNKR
ncbi:DnaJ-like protein subfamily C member 21 [Yarrowia sp. C11]|nr:DnaJ-like protein subfamily C member 21 [Yarrowia sp. E02]KAG5372705.1 DnaJ-like protein subfamily C member 21 [Yarrowia sp. C11]